MGWGELNAWVGAMNRQLEAKTVGPDSWQGADQDPGWQAMRAERDRDRRGW